MYLGNNLIDSTKGDRCTLAHLTTADEQLMGLSYQCDDRDCSKPAFSVDDGGTYALVGSFTNHSTDNTIAVQVDMDSFAAVTADITTDTSQPNAFFALGGLPMSTNYGFFAPTADYLVADLTGKTGTVDTGMMSWGSPVVGTWGAITDTRYRFFRTNALAGTTSEAAFIVGIRQNDLATSINNTTISLQLSPAQHPQLDGQDLFGTTAAASSTPTVTWDPPAVGTPARYVVTFMQLLSGTDALETARSRMASRSLRIQTSGTSVTVPNLATNARSVRGPDRRVHEIRRRWRPRPFIANASRARRRRWRSDIVTEN